MNSNRSALRDFVEMLVRRWWTVATVTTVCLAVAILYSAASTPAYRSQAQVLVNQQSASDIFDPNADTVTSSAALIRRTSNEARFVESDAVRLVVEPRLGFDATVKASTENGSDVVTLTAVSHDPRQAQLVAQTYAEAYLDERRYRYVADFLVVSANVQLQIDEIGEQLRNESGLSEPEIARAANLRASLLKSRDELNLAADLAARDRGQIIRLAAVPEAPFLPRTNAHILLGLFAGLLLGVISGALAESLDQTLRLPDDLESATGLANLAVVPRPPLHSASPVTAAASVSVLDPQSFAAESYRTLRAAFQFMAIDKEIQVIQVTSARINEGTTTTAANLAVAMAMTGTTVALVDSDMRNPSLHHEFGIAQEPGFSNLLIGELKPDQARVRVRGTTGELTVTASGPVPPFPSDLLSHPLAVKRFGRLKEVAHMVIVDSPPVLFGTDALIISRFCDATLFVASSRKSRRRDVDRALGLLERAEAPLVGTVLHDAKRRRRKPGYGRTRSLAIDNENATRH